MLSRRELLRLLCGLPFVLGLPSRARADGDQPAPGGGLLADALARARARGRPLLLLAVPSDADQYGRRQRMARRLDQLLSTKDEPTRLLVANLVLVVAPEADLRAAEKRLAPARDAKLAGAWLVDGDHAELAPGALDGEAEAATQLLERARAVALPGPDGLAPRRDLELRALGAERAAVERDLAGLGSAGSTERTDAALRLSGKVDALAATLTLLVVAPATRDEVCALARDLVLDVATTAVPVGMIWEPYLGGCGDDRYEERPSGMDCGMASVDPLGRRLLYLLAPG